ncbi:MAG: carboxypeptidase regulatory-like domain-containing protein [Gemmatimonadales bacterium]
MRTARRLVAGLLAVAGASCSDGVGPDPAADISLLFSIEGPAAVSHAETNAVAAAFDLVDSYTISVQDSLRGSMLASTSVSVTPGGETHGIDLAMPSSTVGLSVLVTVVGLDGAQELYRAAAYTRIQDVATATPVSLQVRYTGPGVRGTLRNATGAALAGADVDLMQGNTLVQSTTTEADGTYLFVGVATGPYQVTPTPPLGQFMCPSARNVNVTSATTSLTADFQTRTSACQIRLLIVSGGDLAFANDTAAVSAMFATMPNVTRSTFFFLNAVPTLSYLRQFDAVLLFANGLFNQSAQLGNRIAEYVQVGGNVITATFYWQNRSDSSLDATGWGNLEAVDPFSTGAGQTYQAAALNPTATVAHPLTTGLTVLTSTGFRGAVTAKTGTTVVARWNDGSPLIGYQVLPTGSRMVGISLFPASGTAATGDVVTLWRNAVAWVGAAGGPIP